MNQKLPIWDIHGEITSSLAIQNCLIIGAPTGSGKSTQVPQMVVDDILCSKNKVIVLQPRRVAARSLARRVAFERSTSIGDGVGYQVRFENHTSPNTMILGTRRAFQVGSFVHDKVLLSQERVKTKI